MSLIHLGVPVRNQLAPVPGRVVQNSRMDCVWESIGAITQLYWPDTRISGDEIIDFIKGPTFTGAGSAAWAVGDVGHHFGVDVTCFKSPDQHRLISAIRDYAALGVPSLVTIPSAWNSQPTLRGYTPLTPRFSTHVCVADAIDSATQAAGVAQLMNPWPTGYVSHGGYQQVTVGWLQNRLCYGAIWPVAKYVTWRDLPMLPGWEDNGVQLRRKSAAGAQESRFYLVRGFRKFALLHPELFTGLFGDEDCLENEVPSGSSLTTQRLRYVTLIWTAGQGVRLMPNKLSA